MPNTQSVAGATNKVAASTQSQDAYESVQDAFKALQLEIRTARDAVYDHNKGKPETQTTEYKSLLARIEATLKFFREHKG